MSTDKNTSNEKIMKKLEVLEAGILMLHGKINKMNKGHEFLLPLGLSISFGATIAYSQNNDFIWMFFIFSGLFFITLYYIGYHYYTKNVKKIDRTNEYWYEIIKQKQYELNKKDNE